MPTNLRRKAYDRLIRWKESSRGASAILINGARRVGKSYLAREFAQREYGDHVIVDFSSQDDEVADLIRGFSGPLSDLFGAIVTGALLRGNALSAAADAAAGFVAQAIQNTPAAADERYGVWFEPLLPRLSPMPET